MPSWIIQIDGYDPAEAAPVTIRAASEDDDRICMLNGQVWWPAISRLPVLSYDFFSGDFNAERIQTPSGACVLSIDPFPLLPRYALAGARFRLWGGNAGDPFSAWTLRFDGMVASQPTIADGLARIDFRVDDRWLDQPLLTTYAGTGGIEGPTELTGQVEPLMLGAPRFAVGPMINSTDTIFQLSAYGAIQNVEVAFEGLARFGSSFGDYASYSALQAAAIPAGSWATCKAQGLVRHGAPPAGRICYHVQGDAAGPDGWVRLPGAIINRLALLSGGAGKIASASLTALNSSRPWTLSLAVTEQNSARSLVQRIAASVNAVAGISWTGRLWAQAVGIGTPSITLAADGSALPPVARVEQIAVAAPFWRLATQADRTWQVHAQSEVAFVDPTAIEISRDPTPPVDARLNDIWISPTNEMFRREASSANIGTDTIAIGADEISVPSWVSIQDQAIAQALTTAQNPTYSDGTSINALKPAAPGATRNAFRGAWATATAYVVGDEVTYNGSSYVAVTAHTSSAANVPPGSNWALRAAAGATGAAGAPGSAASVLSITNTAQTFNFDGAGAASPATQTITFTAGLENLTGTATWTAQAFNSGGASLGAITLGGTGNTRTMTNAQFTAPGATAYAVVTASLGGYSDTVTIVRLQAGAAGANGAPGVDAIVGFLTNEAITLAADNAGNVSSFTSATGVFKVFQGLTDRTTSSAFSVAASAGCTVTINATTGAYSVTAMSADNASATLQAIYSGVTIQKVLTLSKSRAGATGATGNPGATGASAITGYLTNEAHQVFAFADGSVASYAGATGDFRIFAGTTDISASFTLSTLANPQALTVTYSSRTYTITAGLDPNEDTASLTIRATGSGTYSGVVIDKVFSLSKAKGGYEIVGALPTTNLFAGRVVYLTTNSKIYRYNGSAWTVEVDGADMKAGTITAAALNVTALSAIAANVGTLTAGTIRNTADTFRVDVTAGRTITQTGGYMKVTGAPFGSASQFIEWYGPVQADLTTCTEANAVYYLKTNGSAYFGGSLSAGVIKNGAQTSGITATEQIVVGPFGSNGGTRTVVLSYSYSNVITTNSPGSVSGSASATIVLERWNGSSWVQIGSLPLTGSITSTTIYPQGIARDQYTVTMSGSLTVSDTSGGTSITYRGRIASRTLPTFNNATGPGSETQFVSVNSTE